MDKKKMLEDIVSRYAGGNKCRFAEMVGLSRQGLSTWFARGSFNPELIYSACPGISARWLLTGEGEMSETADTRFVVDSLIDRIQNLSAQLERLKEEKRQG